MSYELRIVAALTTMMNLSTKDCLVLELLNFNLDIKI